MIVAGCDVGSLTSKAVIMVFMSDSRIAAASISKSRTKPQESAEEVFADVLKMTGLTRKEIDFCVGTGYGREKIPFVDEASSEIICHGKGAKWLMPTVRTVIDIGGQDCKVMRLDNDGVMLKFLANDKCASGTGRFLEVMARVLGVGIDELGALSMKSKNPIPLASTCTVWAQADVIGYLNSGVPVEDIAAGVNAAMASRVALLVNSLGLQEDVCMTGGGAKNTGVVSTLEQILGGSIKRIRKADPQLAGAIGAAILAKEMMGRR